MTRIDDVTTTITGALNDHDREATGVCSTGRNVRPANMIARALAAAGHLMPDLPEPDIITPRTEVTPDPIGLWNTDNPPVTGSPSNPPVVFVDENTDLPPNEARAYAYAILAAADYAEEHANDQ